MCPVTKRVCSLWKVLRLWNPISTFCPQKKQCGLKFPRIYFKKAPLPKSVWKHRGMDNCSEKNLSTTYLCQLIKSLICIAALGWIQELYGLMLFSALLWIQTYYLYMSSVFQLPFCTEFIQTPKQYPTEYLI